MLGVLDKALIMGGINNEGHAIARRRFLVEFNRLPRLTVPMLVHFKDAHTERDVEVYRKISYLSGRRLADSFRKALDVEQIVASNRKPCEVSLIEGLNAFYVGWLMRMPLLIFQVAFLVSLDVL